MQKMMVFIMGRVLLEEYTGLWGVWLRAASSSGVVCGEDDGLHYGWVLVEEYTGLWGVWFMASSYSGMVCEEDVGLHYG